MIQKVFTRLKKWFLRYWKNEACAITLALTFVFIADSKFNDPVMSAYAGTAGDTLGFYVCAALRQIWHLKKERNGFRGWNRYFFIGKQTVVNVLREHLLAEVLDLALCRPGLLWLFPALLKSLSLVCSPWWQPLSPAQILAIGTLMGKFSADAVFYGISYWRYERNKHHIK